MNQETKTEGLGFLHFGDLSKQIVTDNGEQQAAILISLTVLVSDTKNGGTTDCRIGIRDYSGFGMAKMGTKTADPFARGHFGVCDHFRT